MNNNRELADTTVQLLLLTTSHVKVFIVSSK